jgi:hypothetical protein
MISEHARRADRVAISAPNELVVSFSQQYNFHKEYCERPDRRARLEAALHQVTGQPVRVRFEPRSEALAPASNWGNVPVAPALRQEAAP